MTAQAITHAAVAVLVRPSGEVLLGLRPEGKPWAGWWEFPGGKVEAGESPQHALVRELHEELGIDAQAVYPWLTRQFDYPEKTVRLHFFMVRSWQGTPYGKEGQALSWQLPSAVDVGPLLPANAPILKALQLPSMYATTNLQALGEVDFFRELTLALENGLRMIHVHEPTLTVSELEQFAAKVIAQTQPYGAKVMISDNVEVAHSVGVDGVHLTALKLMTLKQRPEITWCGATCHNADELAQAVTLGLDFAVLLPELAGQTHPNAQAFDSQAFASMVQGATIPVYAGGVMRQDYLHAAWSAGAHGVAVHRGVC